MSVLIYKAEPRVGKIIIRTRPKEITQQETLDTLKTWCGKKVSLLIHGTKDFIINSIYGDLSYRESFRYFQVQVSGIMIFKGARFSIDHVSSLHFDEGDKLTIELKI